MTLINSLLPLLLAFASLGQSTITQADFTGVGHIYVLNSSNWQTANPSLQVGCIDDGGAFINSTNAADCGTFARLPNYPYTLTSRIGNCTFNDPSMPTNTDSKYGRSDHAWTCNSTYVTDIYDELYTIDGFNYTFLCQGDVDCFYDAKYIPAPGEKVSLWQYHWGSEQLGITPGHVMLQLLWSKIGDLPKSFRAGNLPEREIPFIPGPKLANIQPVLRGGVS